MQDLRVSIIQSDLKWEDKSFNLAHLESHINKIDSNTDIVILPEMFSTAFSMKPELYAEKHKGESFEWMRAQSLKHQIAVLGSLMIQDNGNFYNRFYFVFPNGEYKYYDKRHLFRMGNEQDHFYPGASQQIIEYKGWKIQLLICYDLRFPVWSKNHFADGKYDYDATIIVANWPEVRSHVWKTLLSARAIENQAYYIGINRVGKDGNGLTYSGNSNIYDAKGIPLLDSPDHKEFVKSLAISKDDLDEFRNKFTVGLDWDHFVIN